MQCQGRKWIVVPCGWFMFCTSCFAFSCIWPTHCCKYGIQFYKF